MNCLQVPLSCHVLGTCNLGRKGPSYWKAGKCTEMNQMFSALLALEESAGVEVPRTGG